MEEAALKILILEDDPMEAELTVDAMHRDGLVFTPRLVVGKEAFFHALEEFQPHLVLSDFKMPGFDGLAALAMVQEHFPGLPFLFVTGTMGEEWAVETLKLGATDYVLKDRLFRLVPAIRRAMLEIAERQESLRLQASLVQSEKMADLGSMVAGVSHEVNTPLGLGVTAASELHERTLVFERMRDTEGISEEDLDQYISSTKHMIGLILRNLERAAGLVRSFKSVAVDQSSERQRLFDVRECVESAVMTLHHELKLTKLTVDIFCTAAIEINGYPGALSQIVINLINNSRIHAFEPDEPGQIVMEWHVEANRLSFTYRDNGRGMSEEGCRRIFEPFYTTRRNLGGSGLGMYIVYNLATQTLGGTIACQSSPGCGITIRIDMPIEKDNA